MKKYFVLALASTTEKINATNENEAAFLRNLDCHYTNT
jgi:hypothetical protein